MRPRDHQKLASGICVSSLHHEFVAGPLVQYPVHSRATATNVPDMVTAARVNQLRDAAAAPRPFGTDLAVSKRKETRPA
jgi:hypothetical protein